MNAFILSIALSAPVILYYATTYIRNQSLATQDFVEADPDDNMTTPDGENSPPLSQENQSSKKTDADELSQPMVLRTISKSSDHSLANSATRLLLLHIIHSPGILSDVISSAETVKPGDVRSPNWRDVRALDALYRRLGEYLTQYRPDIGTDIKRILTPQWEYYRRRHHPTGLWLDDPDRGLIGGTPNQVDNQLMMGYGECGVMFGYDEILAYETHTMSSDDGLDIPLP